MYQAPGFNAATSPHRSALPNLPVSDVICEPKGEMPATWHWFSVNGDDDRPVFAFPGVWTRYKGPLKKNGDTVEQEVFAFMTTEPNELTASINHERMPVLLTDLAERHVALRFNGETEQR